MKSFDEWNILFENQGNRFDNLLNNIKFYLEQHRETIINPEDLRVEELLDNIHKIITKTYGNTEKNDGNI